MKSASQSHRQRMAFTLIELLVVIAIIAIIASILFPVLARARENSRRASCQSNMKQLGLAILQYAQDFDEVMPWGQYNYYDKPSKSCHLQNYYSQGYTETWMDSTYPYYKSVQLVRCPTAPAVGSKWNQTSPEGGPYRFNPRYNYGYAFNANILSTIGWYYDANVTAGCVYIGPSWYPKLPRVPLALIDRASENVLLADRGALERHASLNGGCESYQPYLPGKSIEDPAPGGNDGQADLLGSNPDWRHLGTSNFLFADGHVKAFSYDQYKQQKSTLLGKSLHGCP